MGKVVIRTKFNKTGKRVLKIPLDDRQICAPAHQRYREARPELNCITTVPVSR